MNTENSAKRNTLRIIILGLVIITIFLLSVVNLSFLFISNIPPFYLIETPLRKISYLIVLIGIVAPFLYALSRYEGSLQEVFSSLIESGGTSSSSETSGYPKTIAAIILIPLISIFAISFGFGSFQPHGFDTGYYVLLGEIAHENGILYAFLEYQRPIPTIISLILFISFDDTLIIGIFLPYIVAIISSLIVFLASIRISQRVSYSMLATILYIFSGSFIRFHYDLLSQSLSLAFFWLLIVELSRITTKVQDGHDYRNITLLSIILGFILFTSTAFFLLVGAFLAILFIIDKHFRNWGIGILLRLVPIKFRNSTSKTQKPKFLIVLIVSITCIILAWLFLPRISHVVADSSLFNPPIQWHWILQWDSIFFISLFFIGVFALSNGYIQISDSEKLFLNRLAIWNAFLLFLIIVSGYDQSYRFVILFNLFFFAAHGLFSSVNGIYELLVPKISESMMTFRHTRISFRLLLSITIILLIASTNFQNAYVPSYSYFPTSEQTNELAYFRSEFGFENSSVRYMIEKSRWSASTYWLQAYLGRNVTTVNNYWETNLTDSKYIFSSMFTRIPFIVLSRGEELTPTSYLVDGELLNDYLQGVYDQELLDRLNESSFVFADVFNSSWTPVYMTENAYVGENISIQVKEWLRGGFRYLLGSSEIQMLNQTVFSCKANSSLSQIMLEYFYEELRVGAYKIDKLPNTNSSISMIIDIPNLGSPYLDEIRFSFIGRENVTVTVDWLALL